MRPWTELPDPSIPAEKCDWFIGRVASSCLFHTWKRGSTKIRLCKVSIFTGARSCLMHMKEQYSRDDMVCMFRLYASLVPDGMHHTALGERSFFYIHDPIWFRSIHPAKTVYKLKSAVMLYVICYVIYMNFDWILRYRYIYIYPSIHTYIQY